MIRWLRRLIQESRACKAAIGSIRPLVEESRERLNGISDAIWFEPYMVGFISMLITIFAKWEERSMRDDSIGRIQEDAWQAITGLNYPIGKEIILLSESRDEQFAMGCRDAAAIAGELFWNGALTTESDGGDIASECLTRLAGADRGMATFLKRAHWQDVFENYVLRTR
jgi:hypothetical protein